MIRTLCLLLASTFVAPQLLLAQSNSRGPGYDGALYEIGVATYWGRQGGSYPGGEIGVTFMNGLCNPGTMNLAWNAPMMEDHPKFGFLVARLQSGRMVQISDASFCKHGWLSLNTPGSSPLVCGTTPCQNQTVTTTMFVGCYDVYGATTNADRVRLGPPGEIDPWLGTWEHIGSYFDRGDPEVSPPWNSDGIQSPIHTNGSQVKNRVTIQEQSLLGAQSGDLFFQVHSIHEGEPASNRDNNIMSRPFHLSWTGSTWSPQTLGTAQHGSILERWPGAVVTRGGNGSDDGRFAIAVVVTGPTNGLWHYEYAVHNIDNGRGGAAFRVPVCPSGTVTNVGFRDIDDNPLSDWAVSVTAGEVAWLATATNPHDWNQVFNFWFDCDIAPEPGSATLDAARLGPGALSFSVPTTVPTFRPAVDLGAGCGQPAVQLVAIGAPTAGNANFGIEVQSAPATGAFVFFAFAPSSVTFAPGCTSYLDAATIGSLGYLQTDVTGRAVVPLAIPAGFPPLDLYWQAASLIPGGPVYGAFGFSNGLQVRIAASGCQ